jgi:hypothetical protein
MAATSDVKKSRPAPAGMPIEGYDHLSVKAILPQLATLSGPELKAVAAHEKAGKNRVTLLRAVRQVELAREASASRTTSAGSHLTIVDAPAEPPMIPERVAVPERRARKTESSGRTVRRASAKKAAPVEAEVEAEIELADFEADFETEVEAEVELAEFEAEFGVEDMTELEPDDMSEVEAERPVFAPEPAKKKSRPKAAAKQVTWEEEPRPQLPRRIESVAYELDPPVIATAPDLETDLSSPMPGITPSRPPRSSGPAKVARKFEGAALVMAAILAILLGLAIGTILARGGSTSAQGAPAVSSQVVDAPSAG